MQNSCSSFLARRQRGDSIEFRLSPMATPASGAPVALHREEDGADDMSEDSGPSARKRKRSPSQSVGGTPHKGSTRSNSRSRPRNGDGGGKNRTGRHKPGAKKGAKWCVGCRKYLKLDQFAGNQRFCLDDKRKLDAIYKQARSQGETKWFSDMKGDPAKVHAMLTSYGTAQQEAHKVGQKHCKWHILVFKEVTTAGSGVDNIAKGKMMWERQAIEWWKSTEGGNLTEDEAKMRWDEWCHNKAQMCLLHDYKSPNEKKPLRLRIPTDDEVNFKTVWMRAKQSELQGLPTKKPKADDIQKAQQLCMQDHDKIGNGAADLGMLDIARGLLAAGDGEGFHGGNALIGNVRDLVPEDSEDDSGVELEQGEGKEKDQSGKVKETVKDPTKKPLQKAPWFDRDRMCNNGRRECRTTFDNTKKGCQADYEKLKKLVDAIPKARASKYDGEMKIAQTRLTAMNHLLSGTGEKLTEFIQGFMHGAAESNFSPQKPGAAASSSGGVALGQAPPCQGYEKLIIFDEWEAMIDKVLESESTSELKEAKRVFLTYKPSYLVLQKALQKAALDIEKLNKAQLDEEASKLAEERAAGQAASTKAAPVTAGGKAMTLTAMFEYGAAAAKAMVVAGEGTATSFSRFIQ